MASQLLGIKTRFTNDLGSPLVGGQVYTYFAGTSTNQDSYSDAALTVPNTNPVILDDTGSADIFLKGAYRIRVFDKSGRFIEEQDNVTQAASSLDATMLTERVNVIDSDLSKVKSDTGIAVVPKSGSLPITQAVKNAQTISMVEYGATGDGITNDSAAFELLEANVTGREIDLQGRTYNLSYIPIKNNYTNGFFSVAGIIHPSEFRPHELKSKKFCMDLEMGNRYTPDTDGLEFLGSDNVFQSFCIVPQVAGNPRLYLTQRANRDDGLHQANWLKYETYRIVEFEFREDGNGYRPISYSQPLSVGHGGGLDYTIDSAGQLWFYSNFPSDSESDTTRSDKGFSKIKWRGAATSNSDITYYQLFDYIDNPDGKFPYYNKFCIALSEDKKYLGGYADNSITGNQNVLIYTLDDLLSANDPRTVEPVVHFELPNTYGIGTQGMCIHDNKVVMFYDSEDEKSTIQIIDFNGCIISETTFDTFRSTYTLDQLRGAYGVLTVTESEGVYVYGNDIYIAYRDHWSDITTVVSYEGKSYAPRVSSRGVPPSDSKTWQELDSQYAPSPVAWDADTTYADPTPNRRVIHKRVYKLSSLTDAGSVSIHHSNKYTPTDVSRVGKRSGGSVEYLLPIAPPLKAGDTTKKAAIIERVNSKVTRTVSEYGSTLLKGYDRTTPLYVDTDSSVESIITSRGGSNAFSVYSSDNNTLVSSRNGRKLWLSTYSTDAGTGNAAYGAHVQLILNVAGNKDFHPDSIGDVNLGTLKNYWANVYVGTAPIIVSDERLKQDFRSLKNAEKKAALEIKESICLYKMKDSVELKGDGARWHVGVKAQQIVSIMESHGLQPFNYGFICYTEWDAQDADLDDNGKELQAAYAAGDKYAVRYDELAMFILAAT